MVEIVHVVISLYSSQSGSSFLSKPWMTRREALDNERNSDYVAASLIG